MRKNKNRLISAMKYIHRSTEIYLLIRKLFLKNTTNKSHKLTWLTIVWILCQYETRIWVVLKSCELLGYQGFSAPNQQNWFCIWIYDSLWWTNSSFALWCISFLTYTAIHPWRRKVNEKLRSGNLHWLHRT